jgi:peptide-methionine (R)-S-oxide reductase
MTDISSKEELKNRLTDEQYRVTQLGDTEAPFTGEYESTDDPGMYKCVVCGEPLFDSEKKYHSGSGWPSFTRPVDGGKIEEVEDTSLGMIRTEAKCKKCGAHLGHIFPDGPKEDTGLRYCINSAALTLDKKKA